LRQSSIDTQPSVHRYLRRERLAEELTAETFTRAFRARQQFDIATPLRSHGYTASP
jgi:DNA-directed RNA polymerase specialized sigma24 family protein